MYTSKMGSLSKYGVLILILLATVTSYSQTNWKYKPSVYFGFGTGTNIGGVVGIGSEVKFLERFSVNLAFGSIHPILDKEVNKSKFDFDLGMKFYFFEYLFIGINYGFIDYEYISIHDETGLYEDTESYEETRDFSFTLGARTPSYKNLYLSGYLGVTRDKNANSSDADGFLEDRISMPRMGLMLGYEF